MAVSVLRMRVRVLHMGMCVLNVRMARDLRGLEGVGLSAPGFSQRVELGLSRVQTYKDSTGS